MKRFRSGTLYRAPIPASTRIDVACHGTLCLVHVYGEIDLFSSPALDAAIARAAKEHRGAVVVTFGSCTFVDASCLNVLVQRFTVLGARLIVVAGPSSALGRLLQLVDMNDGLPVCANLEEAYLKLDDVWGAAGARTPTHGPARFTFEGGTACPC